MISMSGETDFSYPGNELEVFAHARNWKRYWSGLIAPYVQGDVLELGAGLGVNTFLLRRGGHRRWVALEPDPRLYEHLRACLKLTSPLDCEIRQGTLEK